MSTQVAVRGIQNVGNTCFLSVVLQSLSSLRCFHQFLHTIPESISFRALTRASDSARLTKALRESMRELTPLTAAPVSWNPASFTCIDSLNKRFLEFREQQDAEEFFGYVMEMLDEEIRGLSRHQSSASEDIAEDYYTRPTRHAANAKRELHLNGRMNDMVTEEVEIKPIWSTGLAKKTPEKRALRGFFGTTPSSAVARRASFSFATSKAVPNSMGKSESTPSVLSGSSTAARREAYHPIRGGDSTSQIHTLSTTSQSSMADGASSPTMTVTITRTTDEIEPSHLESNASNSTNKLPSPLLSSAYSPLRKVENDFCRVSLSPLSSTRASLFSPSRPHSSFAGTKSSPSKATDVEDGDTHFYSRRNPFHGHFESIVHCRLCDAVRERHETFRDIPLSIPQRYEGELDIYSLIKCFTAYEEIDGVECPSCSQGSLLERCMRAHTTDLSSVSGNMRTTVTKYLRIGRPTPKALCLSIRRVNACMDKVETHVKFPLRNLDLRSFLSKSEEEDKAEDIQEAMDNALYDLTAVIVHQGSSVGGHFTAYKKLLMGGKGMSEEMYRNLSSGGGRSFPHDGSERNKWVFISDDVYRVVREEDVLRASAYMLFYEKKMHH